MKRSDLPAIESLESRTLFSTTFALPAPRPASTTPTPVTVNPGGIAIFTGTGVTLHLTAGVPFSGKVAFYAAPVYDPPFQLTASIAWGDGTVSQATLALGQQGTAFGHIISGAHTYKTAGTYAIKTTLFLGPIPGLGIETPTTIVTTIASKAIVAARPANSAGGVTIHETAGKKFTAVVGTFNAIAPATGLQATISWGDGTTSVGTLKVIGVVGLDVIKFSVTETHNYALPGTYPVHIVVTKPGLTPTATPPLPIATINSTAVVTAPVPVISLAGTLSGTYTTTVSNPDTGLLYKFAGSGMAGALGKVTASGSVRLPGNIASGKATGQLTLTNAMGSVTLTLTGPAEPGFGPFPKTLKYVISSATGAYAGDTASGTITATLTPLNAASIVDRFTFVLK